MKIQIRRRMLNIVGLAVLTALMAMFIPIGQPVAQAAPWPSRVVYNIYATDGWITTADGVPHYIYGYVGGQAGVPMTYQNFGINAMGGMPVTLPGGPPSPTAGPITAAEAALAGKAQYPGPVVYARVGDIVEVHFKNLGVHVGTPNTPNDPHSIHWHGVDQDAAMDGVPETSLGALPANLPANPGAGNVIVYEVTENYPGTYMYHCHQEASIHVHMGMIGALIFYNPRDAAAVTGPGQGQGGNLWGHKYDADYVMLLHELDPMQNAFENDPMNMANALFLVQLTRPQYWTINGLSFPNTIHAAMLTGGGAWLWSWWYAAHPGMDPFVQGSVSAKSKVLVRVINLGFEVEPMHVHGFHPKILGMDQRPWPWSNPPGITAGQGLEMNTFAPASGQTMELLLDFGTVKASGNYSTQTYSKTNAAGGPVLNTDNTGLPMPDPFSGIVLPAGDYIAGPTVPNLYPWHNHDDYKATNAGIYPGGQFTMVQVNP